MSGKRYSPEEIISKLREAEVYLAEGLSVGEVIRRLGVNKITYCRWRKEYGGMKVEPAKRLKDLEKENARLLRTEAMTQKRFRGASRRRSAVVLWCCSACAVAKVAKTFGSYPEDLRKRKSNRNSWRVSL